MRAGTDNVHGKAAVYDARVITGGGDTMAMMRALPKINVTTSSGSVQTMYPFS